MYDLTKEEKNAIKEHLRRKGLPLNVDVTFSNVALPDEYSSVRTRSEIRDFSSKLLPNLTLNIPFISANMRSVTGAEMIIAIEREGGLGIMPQDLPIDERLKILEKVLRAESAVIDEPICVRATQTLDEAKAAMRKYNVTGLLVVDEANKLVGILSSRDWRYWDGPDLGSTQVGQLMTSVKDGDFVTALPGVSLEEARKLLKENKIEKLPLVDADGKVRGLITARGLFYTSLHPRALRDEKGRFIRVGSIGVIGESRDLSRLLNEVELQMQKGLSALLIDTARSFSVNAEETIEAVKKHFDIPIIAGNTSNPKGVKFLCELGADCVKVGQGPGLVCTTREVGVGIPQLSAVAMASVIARRYGKTIIADGGIRGEDDIVKALIAGADAVMLGYLLAGTEESAPEANPVYSKEFETKIMTKDYYGSASPDAQLARIAEGTLSEARRPEGRKVTVPVIGPLSRRVNDLLNGMRSLMSYVGARNIKELQEKGSFHRQSEAGYSEGVKEKMVLLRQKSL
jgi:IMP dehydrogenase